MVLSQNPLKTQEYVSMKLHLHKHERLRLSPQGDETEVPTNLSYVTYIWKYTTLLLGSFACLHVIKMRPSLLERCDDLFEGQCSFNPSYVISREKSAMQIIREDNQQCRTSTFRLVNTSTLFI